MAEQQPATDYEEALMKTVDEIWSKYDTDGNGTLDRSEMRTFVLETLRTSGVNKNLSQEEFDQIFAQFDVDESGVIERDEMAVFVKRMANM